MSVSTSRLDYHESIHQKISMYWNISQLPGIKNNNNNNALDSFPVIVTLPGVGVRLWYFSSKILTDANMW